MQLLLTFVGIIFLFYLIKKIVSYISNKFYLYIISNVYINSKNKIVKECFIRYNKRHENFEFLVQTSREDWSWESNCNNYTTCNKDLYGDAWDNKFDLQEYDGYVFIDKNTVEKYLDIKENFQEKTKLSINKYTKYDRLKYKITNEKEETIFFN